MSRRSRVPQIRFHKPVGQAYVRLDGKMVYLGAAKPGDIPDGVRDRYEEVIQRWLASPSTASV